MIRKTTITIFASVFLLVSCKTPNQDILFEKDVLIKIIPSIVDSMCQDPRIFLSPPPMLGEFKNTDDDHVIIDTSLATDAQRSRYKIWSKKQDSLKTDTSKIILAINPKIFYSKDSLEMEFKKHFKNKKLLNTAKNIDSSFTIDINSIQLNQKFKFRNSNQFSKSIDIWSKKYDFVFSGFFNVSRILFDDSKSYGVLSAGYTCGGLCGEGYVIYIKKINDKWVIEKIELTWIS